MSVRSSTTRVFFLIVSLIVLGSGQKAGASDEKIADIVADYSRSVVFVGVDGPAGPKIGSGFVVDKSGLILTNYHIISDAQKIYVKLKNKKAYQAALVVTDQRHDIAVLQIHHVGLKPVKLGNSRHLDAGERVLTIGHPLGLENTVSDGLVSAVRKLDDGSTLVQITVPLSPGSSGGPLFDMRGKVVGITTSSFDAGQNLNFAVPIYYAKALIQGIKDRADVSGTKPRRFAKSPAISTARPLALEERDQIGSYTIKPKDTLYALSRRFNTTVDALAGLNQLSGTDIHTGQVIKIPIVP